MNFGRFDLEDLIEGLSDEDMNFTNDIYDFSPKDLDDLINGIPTEESIELYFDFWEEGYSPINLDSFMTLIYNNFDTPRSPHPEGFEYSDNSITIYLDNDGNYWISNLSFIYEGETITPYELTTSTTPTSGPEYDEDDDIYYPHDHPFKISSINEYILFITTFISPIFYISILIYLILSLDEDFINIFLPEDSPLPPEDSFLGPEEDDIPF